MQAPQRRQFPAADLPKKAADLPQLFDVACRVAPRLCAYDKSRPRTLRRDQLYMYAPGSVLATSYMYYTMYSRYSVGRVLPNGPSDCHCDVSRVSRRAKGVGGGILSGFSIHTISFYPHQHHLILYSVIDMSIDPKG
jgi:hypothetical protein